MILFRTDGNSTIGLGHVMRCLSIADAFKKDGENSLFVTSDSGLEDIIGNHGHTICTLDSKFDCMDEEIQKLESIIVSEKPKAIFLDSYFVTRDYMISLQNICGIQQIPLIYIDDLLAFPYRCSVLINYNIYADINDYRLLYKGNLEPEVLLNTSYVPLRAEYGELSPRVVKEKAKDILISTGGADSEHIGLEIATTIAEHDEWREYRFHLIVGVLNEDKGTIDSIAQGQDNIIIHEQVKNMSELMQFCDVAISAAGSTLYELCSTQTPTITYILADNQITGANSFEEREIIHCAGDVRVEGVSALSDELLNQAINLCEDYARRKVIATKMKQVVDGKGTMRIVQEIKRIIECQ